LVGIPNDGDIAQNFPLLSPAFPPLKRPCHAQL
jgi:hypothetical protein